MLRVLSTMFNNMKIENKPKLSSLGSVKLFPNQQVLTHVKKASRRVKHDCLANDTKSFPNLCTTCTSKTSHRQTEKLPLLSKKQNNYFPTKFRYLSLWMIKENFHQKVFSSTTTTTTFRLPTCFLCTYPFDQVFSQSCKLCSVTLHSSSITNKICTIQVLS